MTIETTTTTTTETREERMARETEAAKTAARPAVLLAVPKGRYVSVDRVCDAVNEHLAWKDHIPSSVVGAVLRDAVAAGVLLHERRGGRGGRSDYYAHPTPKLVAAADAATRRKERLAALHEARDAAAEAYNDALGTALGMTKDGDGAWPDGFHAGPDYVRIPIEAMLALLGNDALRERHAAYLAAREAYTKTVNEK